MLLLLKKVYRAFVLDLKHKELIPLKVLYFFTFASLFVLYPYFTIHMRSLGMTPEEAGISATFIPIVAILAPPISGLIADKIGNFKIMLTILTIIGGASALLLLLVPISRETISYPSNVPFAIGCDKKYDPKFGGFLLRSSDIDNCNYITHLQSIEETLKFESCGLVCPFPYLSYNETIMNYTVLLPENDDSLIEFFGSSQVTYNGHEMREKTLLYPLDNSAYFPLNWTLDITCYPTYERKNHYDNDLCTLSPRFHLGNSNSYNSNMTILNSTSTVVEFSLLSYNFTQGLRTHPQCEDSLNQKVQIEVMFSDMSEITSIPASCYPQCITHIPRSNLCSNLKEQIVYDVSLTFWSYTLLRVIVGVISATCFTMFEGAVLSLIKQHDGDYGLQKVFAAFAAMIFSPLSGFLIDYASEGKNYTDFRPAFYLYAILRVICAFITLRIDLDFRQPEKHVLKNVKSVLTNPEILVFFVAIFFTGSAWGYIENFLFWFLQDLGGSKTLMGATITVGAAAGVPLLIFSAEIIKKLGHVNIIVIALLFYAIRLAGYSFITSAPMCLPFEALEGVSTALGLTAATTYALKLSTPATIVSIQGIMGGLYFGVGRGAGSLLGGYCMKWFGTRSTFQIFACGTLIAGVLYFVYNLIFLRKKHQKELEVAPPTDGKLPNNVLTVINGSYNINGDIKKSTKSVIQNGDVENAIRVGINDGQKTGEINAIFVGDESDEEKQVNEEVAAINKNVLLNEKVLSPICDQDDEDSEKCEVNISPINLKPLSEEFADFYKTDNTKNEGSDPDHPNEITSTENVATDSNNYQATVSVDTLQPAASVHHTQSINVNSDNKTNEEVN